MVPILTSTSTLEEPSRGSIMNIYFPAWSLGIIIGSSCSSEVIAQTVPDWPTRLQKYCPPIHPASVLLRHGHLFSPSGQNTLTNSSTINFQGHYFGGNQNFIHQTCEISCRAIGQFFLASNKLNQCGFSIYLPAPQFQR